MRLIENWRDCWIEQLPEPAMWVVRGLAATGISARIIKQKSVEVKDGL